MLDLYHKKIDSHKNPPISHMTHKNNPPPNLIKKLIIFCILTSLPLAKTFAQDPPPLPADSLPPPAEIDPSCDPCSPCGPCNPLRDAYIEVGYSVGDFIGIDEDYAEVDLFIPAVFCNRSDIFLDARGFRFNDDRWAASIGGGFRSFVGNTDHILGVNVYYDYLQGKPRGHFDRIGVGLEWLGFCWDFRINGYFSVGSDNGFSDNPVTFFYPGGQQISCISTEFPMNQSFDAEIGAPLFCYCNFRLYGAAGPYFYKQKNHKDIWGGYARIEFGWEYLTFRVRTSYDDFYHSRTQFSAFLTIPFDILFCWNCCRDCCRDLLIQPVRRNPIIFTNEDCCFFDANF